MESTDSKYTIKDALEIAHKLNEQISIYQQQTILVNECVSSTDEEAIFGLETILAKREAIINEIEPLKQQYQQCLKELGKEQQDKELQALTGLWQKTLVAISVVENDNMQKINKIFDTDKHVINQINSAKRMLNAYQAHHPLSDGIYIDKRK